MAFNAGAIEATLDLDRSPFRSGLAEARKEAQAFEKRGIKVKLNIDKSAIDRIDKAVASVSGTRRGIRVPVEIDNEDIDSIRKEIERIGDNTEASARRSGSRLARVLLNPLVMQLGLIPSVAGAAAAAGAVALGVLPLAMAGVGIAALKSNEQIKSSYAELWGDIKSEAEEIAEPLIDTFLGVSDQIFGSWRRMRPELAAMFADSAPLIESFVGGVLGAAEEAIPRFRRSLQVSGPAMRGFESMLISVGAGVGEMTEEVSKGSSDVGRSADLFGQVLRRLLMGVGELVAGFSGFWADVGPQWVRVFDKLMDSVVGFTSGGLSGLSTGLSVTLGILEAMLNVLGPFADVFGQVGGLALSAVATWKLLAGSLGLVAKAWSLIRPAEMAGRLAGLTGALTNAANASGGWVSKMTGSEKAGERFTSVATKMGNAVVKTAGALPILGTAFAVGKSVIDHYWPAADTLADKIQRGGAEAEEAKGQMYDLAMGYNRGSMMAQTFAATGDEVRAAIAKQREGMTELERAQQDASKAQRDYDYAVDKFGKNSSQAIQAQKSLAYATDEVAFQQEKAADATQTHTDKIIEQTNLMLGAIGARLNYQAGLLQLERSQRALTEAVTEHGKGSLEARDADIAYQQNLLQVVQAIGQRVTAENAALGETRAGELATAAMRMEIARLAVEAGSTLPPALAEMAAGLTDAELKAMGVTREVDNTGTAIYRLPPGKTLNFPNNAPGARVEVERLTTAVYNLPTGDRWLNYYLNYVVLGKPASVDPDMRNIPGLIGQRAKGGPVRANSAYWVGEEGIPELFFPNVDGFVLSGRDSRELMNRMSKDPGSVSIPMAAQGGDGVSQPDFGGTVEAIEMAFQRVLSAVRLEIDGDQWARVVNQANLQNGAR